MMRVDQAIYGTIKNGHALKCASGDLTFAGELAHRLDLPDTEPQGADWSPVTSGFAVRNRYVFARTYSDPSVGRSGMVVSHALICDLDEVAGMDNLSPLLLHFITSFDAAPAAVEPLEIAPVPQMPLATPDLPETARALVSRGSGPIVRIGSDGFEMLMVALWARLWPALRRKLYFRLSFGPKDVVEKPEPTIVCTPTSLVGRWQQQQRIIGQIGNEPSRAAAMIDGSAGGAVLREFRDKIGADLACFEELQLLEQAYAMASAAPDTVARLVSAARLIDRLSPDPGCGEVEKNAIVQRLVGVLPTAQASEILTLRNLALSGFRTSDLVWEELEAWLHLNGYPPAGDANMVSIIDDALIGKDAVAPWREAATRGLKRSAVAKGSRFAASFWRWAKSEPRISSPLVALIANDRKGLEALEAAAPADLDTATASPVIASAAKLKLFRLHAVAVGASMKPKDAAGAQSALEPGTDPSAMRLALRGAKPGEILDTVASVPDPRLLAIAGETAAKDPALLARRDMTTASNRSIWAAALKVNAGAWCGPQDPQTAFEQLLDEQIDGRTPPMELLELLSASPMADLMRYPRRSEVWESVPTTVRDRLLAATADAWFVSAGARQQNAKLEPQLVDAVIRDPRLDELLTPSPGGTLADGLHLIEELGELPRARFRGWVSAAVRVIEPLTAADADLLGRALASRGQRDVVDDMISLCWSGRSDVRLLLRHCVGLVGLFDRWSLGLSPISATEKWDVLTDLAAQLFPLGPDENGLWERSGGRDADIRHDGTGKERWRRAIRDIQNGKQPRVSRLLQQMRSDFPENPNLKLMASDPLFRA